MYEVDGVPQKRVMKRDRELWLTDRLSAGVRSHFAIEYAYYDVDSAGTPLAIQRSGYHPLYRDVAVGATTGGLSENQPVAV